MFRRLTSTITKEVPFVRSYATRYFNKHEGIFYPGGFTYYPRDENEVTPKIDPPKLFMVKRIKPFKGNPHWEKKILRDFKLEGNDVAIVKNIPENNGRLWRVKHLVEIKPITFPNGEPTENDINCSYLKENGELIISKSLEVSKERLEATEKFKNDPVKLDGNTLRVQSRKKWLSGW
ncbi:39S ribosomal protein L30, mitochondrial [Chrysoperla carnea]|uniref:39S ribosomal protein L30, mitochondrial n=1 Tax=Chrysoperla carnea TaxID=189513 RepID=UPI001D0983B5|nr:39S ribosomal protein L30, mitochondrial [Chrysoperla carnea]